MAATTTALTSATLGELLSPADVARILHTSENTVRWWLQQGRLASIKIGRRRFVQREALDRFIATEIAKGVRS